MSIAPGFSDDDDRMDNVLTHGVITLRVIGWVADTFILALLATLLWFALAAFTVITLGFGAPMFAVLALLPGAYGWLCLASSLQATPGQAMMGLIVVRDADLGPPTGLQALVSVIGYAATLALGAIWCAIALFTTRHRTVHDILSGLVVVRRDAVKTPLTTRAMG